MESFGLEVAEEKTDLLLFPTLIRISPAVLEKTISPVNPV
jgi:hypothetical protein